MSNFTPTASQLAVIDSEAEELVALAGPGAGKTATLVARISKRIALGVSPSEIVVLTFTNAAANELANRLPDVELGFLGTLHSFALRMVRELGWPFSLVSPEDAQDLLASKARTLGCKLPIAKLLELKARGRPEPGKKFDLASTVVASHIDEMRASFVVDYDGLLAEFERLLQDDEVCSELACRYTHLFVDEAQDSATVDWRIYARFPARFLCFVGDADQAIYGFRGGRVDEFVLRTSDASTKVVKLEENHRSREEICVAAQRLIERNSARFAKETRSVRGPGGEFRIEGPFESDLVEATEIVRDIRHVLNTEDGPPSVGVLARTNEIADFFRDALLRSNVPVVAVERTPLPPDWPRARALVELLPNPENDALAFFYLVARYVSDGATPKDAREAAHAVRNAAGVAGKSINRANLGLTALGMPESIVQALAADRISRESRALVADLFRSLHRGATVEDLAVAVAEVRERVVEEPSFMGVRVSTIHGAKGREFNWVYLVGFEDEVIPGRAVELVDVEEERRLAYVAMTRARDVLVVSSARTRRVAWRGTVDRTPSRFLAEMLTTCR